MSDNNSITTVAKRLLPAIAQSNPLTAGICRLYDDQIAAEKELNLTRALQVVEHRIGVNKDRILEQESQLAKLTEIVRTVPLDKSELHATVCAKLAAGGYLMDEVALARFYISKLSQLDYLEVLVLFGEVGMLVDARNQEQLESFTKNSPSHFVSITNELSARHLLVENGSELPYELKKLLDS